MATERPRLSRNELRDLFIEAGRGILREEGIGAGGDSLTFKRARERVEAETGIRVTNASLIGRIWIDQFDYQTDVLAAAAADDSASEIADTLEDLAPVLMNMNPSSEESRRSTMREVCRISTASNTRALRQSTDWLIWIGIWAITAVGGSPDRRSRIDAALEQSYQAVTERMEGIYQAGMDFIGYRVRPGLTVRQFTIAVAALAEGCVLRDRVDSKHMNGIIRPTGPDGEEQEWSLFGLALDALSSAFFELDPDWSTPGVDQLHRFERGRCVILQPRCQCRLGDRQWLGKGDQPQIVTPDRHCGRSKRAATNRFSSTAPAKDAARHGRSSWIRGTLIGR